MRRSTRRSRTKRHRQRTRRGGEVTNWSAYSQHLDQAMKPQPPPPINWNSYSQHLGNAMKPQPAPTPSRLQRPIARSAKKSAPTPENKSAPTPKNKSGYSLPVKTKEGQDLSNMIHRLESRYKNIHPPTKPQPPGIRVTYNKSKTSSVGVGNPIRKVGF